MDIFQIIHNWTIIKLIGTSGTIAKKKICR